MICVARVQGPEVAQLRLLWCSLCSPAGRQVHRRTVTAACWAGQGLPGMGSEGPTLANCPVSKALTCDLWGEAGANPAVPSHSFHYSPVDFGTHHLSVSIHLSSVYQGLGNLLVKSTTPKDLGSNPSLVFSKLCDLGQILKTL